MIQKLVEVKYRKEQDSFLRLIMQENRLRASLRQLDLHLEQSRECQDVELKSIGADVVWQAWGGRKKRELNMQLAQVLAVKERHISQVRKSYGKVLVSDALFDDACTKYKQKMTQSQLDHALLSITLGRDQ
tara:strand:+ start:108 stop:500 length:393 start_codon:yes stop_codon:yes gene_type:complete